MTWLEIRPDAEGNFDEIVARFADGSVHVEAMSKKAVFIAFECGGEYFKLWIDSDKKLEYHHERTGAQTDG